MDTNAEKVKTKLMNFGYECKRRLRIYKNWFSNQFRRKYS